MDGIEVKVLLNRQKSRKIAAEFNSKKPRKTYWITYHMSLMILMIICM